jgi:hypothetical protein
LYRNITALKAILTYDLHSRNYPFQPSPVFQPHYPSITVFLSVYQATSPSGDRRLSRSRLFLSIFVQLPSQPTSSPIVTFYSSSFPPSSSSYSSAVSEFTSSFSQPSIANTCSTHLSTLRNFTGNGCPLCRGRVVQLPDVVTKDTNDGPSTVAGRILISHPGSMIQLLLSFPSFIFRGVYSVLYPHLFPPFCSFSHWSPELNGATPHD